MRDLSQPYFQSRDTGTYEAPSIEDIEMTTSGLKTASRTRASTVDNANEAPDSPVGSRDDPPSRRSFLSEREADSSLPYAVSSTSSYMTDVSSQAVLSANAEEDEVDEYQAYRLSTSMLSIDPDVKSPSRKHREKLNAWYQKRSIQTPATRKAGNTGGGFMSWGRRHGNPINFIYSDHVLSNDKSEDSYMGEGTFDDTVGSRTFENTVISSNTYDNTLGAGTFETVGQKPLYSRALHEEDFLKTKIEMPWASIGVATIQLLVLITQLAMCGVARLEVNPMIGPYPDAFSEWGGKNAYLTIQENQWWRLLTSSFLHVGVLHLLINALCIFWIIAFFEREWGSLRWICVFLLCSVGSNAAACAGDADTIAVGSSGAVMGLFSAKIAQVLNHTCFAVRKNIDNTVQYDQLVGVFFGIAAQAILSSSTYIDGWGHAGGVLSGFFCGLLMFSNPIISCCARFTTALTGLFGLCGSLAAAVFYLVVYVEPIEDIADPCQYFRSLFSEGYRCECAW